MSEKRFKLDIGDDYSFIDDIIQDETYTIYNDRFKEVWGQKIVDLLNVMNDTLLEQAKQVSKLSEENEQLRQSRDYWCKSAKLHSKYFNCLEKAIERAYEEKPYPTEDDINRIYAELEKELKYE